MSGNKEVIIKYLNRHYSPDINLYGLYKELLIVFSCSEDITKDIFNEFLKSKDINFLFPEDRIIELTENSYIKDNFIVKNDIKLFELDYKNKEIWCSYTHTWEVFSVEYGMKNINIQLLIKSWLYKAFKIEGLTPKNCPTLSYI